MAEPTRVYVEFARELDSEVWRERHLSGKAPDATPYGLHFLSDFGNVVRFRPAARSDLGRRVAERTRSALWGTDLVPALTGACSPTRLRADVVLCMDEQAGIAAALTPGGPPVVSGVAWLESPEEIGGLHRRVSTAALRRMAGMFTQCSAMVEPLVKRFGIPDESVHTVRLGIDSRHFVPAPRPSGPPTVFSVGDDRMRDHETLVAAMTQVHGTHPRMRFELATTLPVEVDPGFGIVHRRRMDEAVRECYARADVVAVALHPTRQGSGLTVILETMASGRPLVVTDNPGLRDYIDDGVTGILVPAGDPRAMAEAVSDLLSDPDRARRMGMAGRRLIERRFTSRHMASDLAQVLRTALRLPGAAPGPVRQLQPLGIEL